MNKSVAKIIIWSTVSICLIVMMIFISFSGDFLNFVMSPFNGDGTNLKTIRTTELDVANIDSIDLDFAYGVVYLSSYDGDKIIIDEKSNKDIDKDELLSIKEDNGTLYLKQPSKLFNIFNFFKYINKKMVRDIKLPAKIYNQIKTDFSSGNFNVDDIESNSIDIKMTSGKTDMSNTISSELLVNITSGRVDIDGSFEDVIAYATSGSMSINSNTISSKLLVDITSGNVDIKGSFDDITTYATSGSVDIKSGVTPSKMLIDITSGRTSVTIPDNEGFVLGKEKTSGSFHSDFALDDYNTYKNGHNKYRVKMTSGSVSLLKAE